MQTKEITATALVEISAAAIRKKEERFTSVTQDNINVVADALLESFLEQMQCDAEKGKRRSGFDLSSHYEYEKRGFRSASPSQCYPDEILNSIADRIEAMLHKRGICTKREWEFHREIIAEW